MRKNTQQFNSNLGLMNIIWGFWADKLTQMTKIQTLNPTFQAKSGTPQAPLLPVK